MHVQIWTRLPRSSGKVLLCLAIAVQWWQRHLKGWWQDKDVPISVWSIKWFKLLFHWCQFWKKWWVVWWSVSYKGSFLVCQKTWSFRYRYFWRLYFHISTAHFYATHFSLQSKYQNICHFCVILVDWVYKYFLGLQEGKKSCRVPCWRNSFCYCFVLLFSCDIWFHYLGNCSS